MLNPDLDSLETKYFAVLPDLTYKEIRSLEKLNFSPLFLVKKENKGKTKSLYNDDFFAHSKYTFYNPDLSLFVLEINNWVLVNINELKSRNREVIFEISDPNGEIRGLSSLRDLTDNIWSTYFQLDGICKISAFINKMAKFKSWDFFDIKSENKKLKKRISKLKLEIEELKKNQ